MARKNSAVRARAVPKPLLLQGDILQHNQGDVLQQDVPTFCGAYCLVTEGLQYIRTIRQAVVDAYPKLQPMRLKNAVYATILSHNEVQRVTTAPHTSAAVLRRELWNTFCDESMRFKPKPSSGLRLGRLHLFDQGTDQDKRKRIIVASLDTADGTVQPANHLRQTALHIGETILYNNRRRPPDSFAIRKPYIPLANLIGSTCTPNEWRELQNYMDSLEKSPLSLSGLQMAHPGTSQGHFA